MKRYMLSSLLFVAFAAHAQDNATNNNNIGNTDLSGSYICQGTTPDNVAYQDTQVTITKSDQTYQLTWKNKKYGDFKGTGIVNPSDNSITSAFYNVKKNSEPVKNGIIIYKADSNGGLTGTWTFNSNNKLGSETCKKGQ